MESENKYVNKLTIRILGISLVLSALLVVYFLYKLWPIDTAAEGGPIWEQTTNLLWFENIQLSDEQRIIALVILSGLLGSFIHTANSFSAYVGARQFERSWIWWYLLRPFVGMSIALIFYLVFRGGLFSGNTTAQDLNIYGILTLAALTGLFSDRATLKLEEVFDNLFRPQDHRDGKLDKEVKPPE